MKEIKASGEYKIYEKRSGRYAVKDKNKQYVNGDEKAKILADAGLVTIPEPKPVAESEPSKDAVADEVSEEEAAEASSAAE